MQWLVLLFWGALAARKRSARLLTVALALSMAVQLCLLQTIGALTAANALPLHLCSFSALVCPWMFGNVGHCGAWHARLARLATDHMLLLGAPCALLALCFPAVMRHPVQSLMDAAFYSLHALLLVLTGLRVWQERGRLWVPDRRTVFVLLNALAVAASAVNRVVGANYLFLRMPPVGTPLAWLAANGMYLLSLEMAAMLMLVGLREGYVRLLRMRKVAAEANAETNAEASLRRRR